MNQKCVRDHKVSFEPARRHDVSAKPVSPEKIIRCGDVLINSTGTGTLGRVALVRSEPPTPTTVDSHVTIVRPQSERFVPSFFGYMLISIEDKIKEAGMGASGQTELARSVLANEFTVTFPESTAEQQRIVGILDKTFDGIAKAKSNAEVNWRNSKELWNSEVTTAFSNNSSLWETYTISALSENMDNRRIPITRNVRKPGDIPYYGASGIVDHVSDFIFDDDILLISEDGANLLARATPIAFSVSGKCWVNNHAHVVRFSDADTQKCVEYFLNHLPIDGYITGTAQPKLTQKALNSIPIRMPKSLVERKSLARRFDDLSAAVQGLNGNIESKMISLDQLKVSLLHQAFSGKL